MRFRCAKTLSRRSWPVVLSCFTSSINSCLSSNRIFTWNVFPRRPTQGKQPIVLLWVPWNERTRSFKSPLSMSAINYYSAFKVLWNTPPLHLANYSELALEAREQWSPLAFIWVAETSIFRPFKLNSNCFLSASVTKNEWDADESELESNLLGLRVEVSATHMKARGHRCSWRNRWTVKQSCTFWTLQIRVVSRCSAGLAPFLSDFCRSVSLSICH